jgi:ferrous iron transport protein B
VVGAPQIALVGNPNSGKSSLFNRLTGLRSKTGNYPGVTVSRFVGGCAIDGCDFTVEDLPGSYSLEPISPDEEIVADILEGRVEGVGQPDVVLAVVDATTLQRGLVLVSQLLQLDRPVCLVVTFTDELVARQGTLDVAALGRAVGVPAIAVVANRTGRLTELRELLKDYTGWPSPPVPPPSEHGELDAWIVSVLHSAGYRAPQPHQATRSVDRVLLHPLWGAVVFLGVMFAFFQIIFGVAAPLQGLVESLFGWLGGLVEDHVGNPVLSGLLGHALIGGVGGVVVFVPQIMLLFLLISILEGVGYLSRAAFLMDRLLARFGLEGRAFVALLSSFACAVPGIMATRTMPSAKERIATMMAAPLMTCSARLPVYVLLIGLLVPTSARVGPVGAQGLVMFGLYLLGAVSAMLAAWVFRRLSDRGDQPALPFYLEMPPYRIPSLRSVLLSMWESAVTFLRKVGSIILLTTVALWVLLNLPAHSAADLTRARHRPRRPVGRSRLHRRAQLCRLRRAGAGAGVRAAGLRLARQRGRPRLALGARDLRGHDGPDLLRGQPRGPGPGAQGLDLHRRASGGTARLHGGHARGAAGVLRLCPAVHVNRGGDAPREWHLAMAGHRLLLHARARVDHGAARPHDRGGGDVMPEAAPEDQLVPVHPETVAGDAQRLRWVTPVGSLPFLGPVAVAPRGPRRPGRAGRPRRPGGRARRGGDVAARRCQVA